MKTATEICMELQAKLDQLRNKCNRRTAMHLRIGHLRQLQAGRTWLQIEKNANHARRRASKIDSIRMFTMLRKDLVADRFAEYNRHGLTLDLELPAHSKFLRDLFKRNIAI